MEFKINLTKIANSLIKKAWIILVAVVVTGVLSMYIIDENQPNMYSTETTIYAASENSYADSLEGIRVLDDYVGIVQSYKVAVKAAEILENTITPEEIQSMISAYIIPDSNIITITAMSQDTEMLISVSNAVAEAFVEEGNSITVTGSIQVLDQARDYRIIYNAVTEAWTNRIIMVAGVGLFLAAIFVCFSIVDSRVMFKDEATLDGKLELLGVIPDKKKI